MMTGADKIVEALLETDEVDPKGFIQAHDAAAHPEPILVHGSYGTLKVDPDTGIVVGYEDYPPDDPDERGDAYYDIVRFDLEELRRWIKANGSPEWANRADEIVVPGNEFDIVDVSFWTNGGEYVPGEEDHRRMSWGNAEPG